MAAPSKRQGSENARLVRLVAARGLPGGAPLESPPEPDVAGPFVEAARIEGLTGPLFEAVRAGEVDLPESARARLVDAHRKALVWCLAVERRLLEVHGWLREAGVPVVVVKGSAAAMLDHADPAERTFSDVDLLVPAEHIDRAVSVIGGHGLVRRSPEVRPGWDRRFTKSITLVGVEEVEADTPPAEAVEIDVHRTLSDGVFGVRIPLDRLHATTVQFELGGVEVRALGPTQRALHAAYHAVVGSQQARLSNLREIALHLTSGPPLDEVVAEAARWRGEAVLAAAVQLVHRELSFEAPEWSAWADAVDVPDFDRRAAAFPSQGDAGLARHRLYLVAELSPRDKAAYLWGVAFPSPELLASEGHRRVDRYLRWVPQLVRPGGRSGPPKG